MAPAVSSFRTFEQNERGSVAILFGIMLFAVLMIAGLAIDYGRILVVRSALISASDAAGLAAGRALLDGKLSAAEAKLIGETYFKENAQAITKGGADIPTPTVNADPTTATVTVEATAIVPMTLLRVGGFETVKVPVKSKASFDVKDIEVALALDVTGSMGDPAPDGKIKITSMKTAVQSFIETVLPNTPPLGQKIRIGLAPYAASVNLGKFAAAGSNSRSKDGCVTERKTASYTGMNPTVGGFFLTKADSTTDVDLLEGSSTYTCTKPSVMPLTDQKSSLISEVKSFTPGGFTAGHLGAQWGWNLVSEDFASFWGGAGAPDAYSKTTGPKPKLVKVVVLMTDGIFNTAFNHDTSKKQALALCDGMKAKGILVFTIGFGFGNNATDKNAKDTLQSCATPATPDAQYFFDAATGSQLGQAFDRIAAFITKLHVAQ